MDKPVSNNIGRRSPARESLLPALVERLTERGIIRPEEAEDMLALLTAFSDQPPGPDASTDSSGRRQSKGLTKTNTHASRGNLPSHGTRRPG